MLQQLLPFTVLKRRNIHPLRPKSRVATALTVYGIETASMIFKILEHGSLQQLLPFTVLKRSL